VSFYQIASNTFLDLIMKLSIVTTLYHSANYIDEFYQRMTEEAQKLVGNNYEIILVNDGSPDNSLDIAIELTKLDDKVLVVDLSRNFGHHKAIMTGLSYASGDFVFLIDVDLEEEPEWLSEFYITLINEDKCDVVFGVQNQRKGGWFERFSGWLFYSLFNTLTGFRFPRNWVTARLMTQRYVHALLKHQEREVSIGGLYLLTGFKQTPQFIDKHSSASTTYTFAHKLSLLINSVTSFSNKPLVGIFYTGNFILMVAGVYTLYLIINWLLGTPLSGWTSVMASVWLLGGLIISFIGVVGVYLSKIFSEVKQRPYTIIRQLYSSGVKNGVEEKLF